MAASSWFRVTGSAEDADPCMCAGQDVEIALAARDGFGNAIESLGPDAIKAVATGNDVSVKFEPCEHELAGEQFWEAALPARHVYARGQLLPGGGGRRPGQQGNRPDPATQRLEPPRASEEVVVTPHDSFGNPGASGGRLAAELVQEEGGPPDADPTPCHVVESTTGGLPASLEPTA
ncbi:MAG: hypothetical protein MMC33_008462 [Icmadophila ericetorum]|nr:hypothetical protein [Icmadophila ericetorum]